MLFGKGLTPAICSRMAVFVSRQERVMLITFLLPLDLNFMGKEFGVESKSYPTSLTYSAIYSEFTLTNYVSMQISNGKLG